MHGGARGRALPGSHPAALSTAFCLASRPFGLELGLFATVLGLVMLPRVTLVRWRRDHRRGRAPDGSQALVVVMVSVASFMARGFGLR